ncbi:glycine cleavage system aminomethyltransferase GcvT [Oricola sp.]|uniref:glycine cleavage system aminomethyltransferase GcvT n=1 Tax=Oricola sp. TaxID=1979950 RepID=UPI003BADA66F
MSDAQNLKQLPLMALHEKAGAKFAPFAGWSMPVSYPLGVMKEHLHTRAHAGLFDISHMRVVRLDGADAAGLVASICPLDPAAMADGGSKYSFLLNENAGLIDDLIVTRIAADRFMVVANAGRADVDISCIKDAAANLDVTVEPLDRVILALQGPEAAAIIEAAGIDITGMAFMNGRETAEGWFVARSGYTGEDGFEIAIPSSDATAFADKLLADDRVAWIGLAARDSLRLEAGLCLYGSDLDEETDPVSAGLLWAVPKHLRSGGVFAGAVRLSDIIAAGPQEKRVGLQPEGRQPVRGGAALADADGNPAGRVTSGGFGPSVGHPVSMGYVRADLATPDTQLFADVRGKSVAVRVVKLPFITKRSKG